MLLAALKNKAIDKREEGSGREENEVIKKNQADPETKDLAPQTGRIFCRGMRSALQYSEFAPEEMSRKAIRKK